MPFSCRIGQNMFVVMLRLVLWVYQSMSLLLLTQHVRRGRARACKPGLGSLGWGRAVDHRHHPCSAPERSPQQATSGFTFALLTEWVMWWSTYLLFVLFLPTKPCCRWRCHRLERNWVIRKKSIVLKIWIWNQLNQSLGNPDPLRPYRYHINVN